MDYVEKEQKLKEITINMLNFLDETSENILLAQENFAEIIELMTKNIQEILLEFSILLEQDLDKNQD